MEVKWRSGGGQVEVEVEVRQVEVEVGTVDGSWRDVGWVEVR